MLLFYFALLADELFWWYNFCGFVGLKKKGSFHEKFLKMLQHPPPKITTTTWYQRYIQYSIFKKQFKLFMSAIWFCCPFNFVVLHEFAKIKCIRFKKNTSISLQKQTVRQFGLFLSIFYMKKWITVNPIIFAILLISGIHENKCAQNFK